MSNAFYLTVSYDGEEFTEVIMGRKATGDLFHYLLPIMLEKALALLMSLRAYLILAYLL